MSKKEFCKKEFCKKEFCKKHGFSDAQFLGEEKINDNLCLDGLTSIPDGFSPTVGDSLWLNGLTSIPDGFSPTVGGSLRLNGLTSIPDGFSPTVGGSLWLDGLTSIPEGFSPTVGGNLCLNGLTSIPEGFSPTVGVSLCLDGLTSIPDGFSPTVGGSLYLNGLTSIPEGFSPTVGDSLYLNGLTKEEGKKIQRTDIPDNFIFTWENGKYIQVDGIFSEVVSRRGNILKVKFIGEKKVTYLITDGQGCWAHGENLKEAREDLVYKISDRNASKYTGLTLDSRLSFKKAIEAYRVITGACAAGTRMFVENLPLIKKSYKISEIVELTRGAYGNREFESFFVK